MAVIPNAGASPAALPSASLWSPSRANASLRMANRRPVVFAVEATVKSHASYSPGRLIFARARAAKMPAYRACCERSRAGRRRPSRSSANHFGAGSTRP